MVRDPTPEDWPAIEAAVRTMLDWFTENPSKQIHRHINQDKTLQHIREGCNVKLVHGYLVHYGLTVPWYSDAVILSELLVVRVGLGGTLRDVAQFLREEARAVGADFVAVGTALAKSDRALSRLYQAEGYRPEAITLTVEP